MIYLIMFIILVYLSYKYDYCPKYFCKNIVLLKKGKRSAFIFVGFIMILIVGLRYRIGLDTISYERSFQYVVPLSDVSRYVLADSEWDPLFYLFISLSKTLCNEFWFFQLFQALFVNTIFFRFIWKNCDNKFTCITIYYIFLYLSFACETMRESCAVAMFLLGWEFLKKDKWIVFSFFLLLSYGFHTSAIALFILPFLKITKIWDSLKIGKAYLFFLLGLLMFGSFLSIYMFDYISLINISSRFYAKVFSYAEEQYMDNGLNIIGILSKIFQFVFYPLIAVTTLKITNPEKIKKNQEQIIMIGLIFVFLSLNITILYRYQNYFMPFAFITVADMFYNELIIIGKSFRTRIKSFHGWLLYFFPAVLFWWAGMNQPVHGDSNYRIYMVYYPYSTILNPNIDRDREAVFSKFDLY